MKKMILLTAVVGLFCVQAVAGRHNEGPLQGGNHRAIYDYTPYVPHDLRALRPITPHLAEVPTRLSHPKHLDVASGFHSEFLGGTAKGSELYTHKMVSVKIGEDCYASLWDRSGLQSGNYNWSFDKVTKDGKKFSGRKAHYYKINLTPGMSGGTHNAYQFKFDKPGTFVIHFDKKSQGKIIGHESFTVKVTK